MHQIRIAFFLKKVTELRAMAARCRVAAVLVLAAAPTVSGRHTPGSFDAVCTAEYAPKCPQEWRYTAERGGTCNKPTSSASHCDSLFAVDGWDVAKKHSWEGTCDVLPGWPTARCPAEWEYSSASGGRCDAAKNASTHCSPIVSIDSWTRLQKLAWQGTCGTEWVCAGAPPEPPAPVPSSPPPEPVPVPGCPGATVTATAAHDLQDLFLPQPPWLGADCATTVALPNGKVLWIHQDTLVGKLVHHPSAAAAGGEAGGFDTRQQHCMPHNSVALMERTSSDSGSTTCAAELERVCSSTSQQQQPCAVCCGHHQHELRTAGCSAADCTSFCDSSLAGSWNLTHYVRGECTAQWCPPSSSAACSADPEALGANSNGFFAPINSSRWYGLTPGRSPARCNVHEPSEMYEIQRREI